MQTHTVAIKKMFNNPMNDGDDNVLQRQQFFDDNEVSVFMQICRHKRIVLFFGAGELDDGTLFMVTTSPPSPRGRPSPPHHYEILCLKSPRVVFYHNYFDSSCEVLVLGCITMET